MNRSSNNILGPRPLTNCSGAGGAGLVAPKRSCTLPPPYIYMMPPFLSKPQPDFSARYNLKIKLSFISFLNIIITQCGTVCIVLFRGNFAHLKLDRRTSREVPHTHPMTLLLIQNTVFLGLFKTYIYIPIHSTIYNTYISPIYYIYLLLPNIYYYYILHTIYYYILLLSKIN